MITQDDIARWRKLCAEATQIDLIEGDGLDNMDPIPSQCFDAITIEDDGCEFSVATFDRHEDALLFASAAPIIRRLLSEVDLLRAALEAVEWSGPPHTWIDERDEWCQWCGNYRPDGHRADCQRQIALGVAP